MDLRLWLQERREEIRERWHALIRIREDRREDAGDGLLGSFLGHLTDILSRTLGDRRDEAEEIWQLATHLYGSLALRRGLAAGEVVEELQLLREVILRLLLQEPVEPGSERSGLTREFLILNRIVDTGVVQASVAYIDDLFFAHLQGSGIPGPVTPEVEEEIERQLANLARELQELERGPEGTP